MTTWEKDIGSFQNIRTNTVGDHIGKALTLYLLARRQNIFNEHVERQDNYEDPYFKFLTLDDVLNPKEKEDGVAQYHTYECDEMIIVKHTKGPNKGKSKKDDDGKVIKKLNSDPKKKKAFVTIGIDLKHWYKFILNKFMFEVHQCYVANGHQFHDPAEVTAQVMKYANNNLDEENMCNFIIHSCDLMDADAFVDDDDIYDNEQQSLLDYLYDKVKEYFRDDHGKPPVEELKIILKCFIKHLKINATMLMAFKWGTNLATLHPPVMKGIVMQLYTFLKKNDIEYAYDMFSQADKWVAETMLKKKNTGVKKTKTTIDTSDVNSPAIAEELDAAMGDDNIDAPSDEEASFDGE
jgi:hypothetical protein